VKIFRPKFNTTSLLLLVFFILCFLSILWRPSWQIGGDGFGYYSYIRSFIFDRDFNLANEFSLFDSLYNHDSVIRWQSSVNQIANPYAVGSAILWSPFILIAFIISKLFNFYDPYFIEGFNFPYQAAVAMGTWTYFLLGLALLFNTFRKIIGDKYAWLGILVTVGLSPVVFYLVYEPSMAHGLTVFSESLFFYIIFKIYQAHQVYWKDYLILGISIGFLFLIRWQDLIFAIIPLIIILRKIYLQKNYQPYLKVVILVIASFILTISPQLFMWKHLFGSWLVVPQGESFFHLTNPHIWQFLLSSHHGMFAVHPLLIFAIMGLVLFYRQNKFLAGLLFLALIIQIYINSALYDWYGGGSFGARRMLSSFFIFALGFSWLIKSIFNKKILLTILIALVFTGIIFNALLMVSYARGIIPLIDFTTYIELYLAPIKVLNSL
jgi:hypothetical protein